MSFLAPGVYGRHNGAPMVWRTPQTKKVLLPVLDKLDDLDDEPPPYWPGKAHPPPPDPDPSDDPSSDDDPLPPRRQARRRRRRPRRPSDASASNASSNDERPRPRRPRPGWFNRHVHVRIPDVVRSFVHWVAARLLLPAEVVDLGFYVIENALTHLCRRRANFIREHPEVAFAPPWKQQRWLRGDVREDEVEEYRLARYPWWEREAAKRAMERGKVHVWPKPEEEDGPCFVSNE